MNRQPDKLFRDKLQNYQTPASPETWKTISQNLHQKNHGFLWLKIAASILLLACAGALIFSGDAPRSARVISEKMVPPSDQKPEAAGKVIPEKSNPPAEKQARASTVTRPLVKARGKKAGIQGNPASVQELTKTSGEQVPAIAIAESENEIPETDPTTEQQSSETTGSSTEKINERAGRLTIVYSANEVNEKYLNKNTTAEATSEEKESSTFRKLIDKAYDLKHNQDPLGDLRQKKNEILALNFKSEKQRNEND
jgi:hypothetical protein